MQDLTPNGADPQRCWQNVPVKVWWLLLTALFIAFIAGVYLGNYPPVREVLRMITGHPRDLPPKLPSDLPAVGLAQSPCPGIHVKVLNIRNSTGTVACALFESPVGFPAEYLHFATNIMVIKVRDAQARCDFEDIPPGAYALAVVHDENMNGKLDTNRLGIPTEGYGFSNEAKALLGAPSFSATRFPYDGENLDLTISLHY